LIDRHNFLLCRNFTEMRKKIKDPAIGRTKGSAGRGEEGGGGRGPRRKEKCLKKKKELGDQHLSNRNEDLIALISLPHSVPSSAACLESPENIPPKHTPKTYP
jgi:hypothetical protein